MFIKSNPLLDIISYMEDKYEFNKQLTKDMVVLLRNKTSNYNSEYMKTLFNTWS